MEILVTQDRLGDQALTPRHELVNIVELANDVVSSTQLDAAHALIVRSDGPINAYCARSLTSICAAQPDPQRHQIFAGG